MLLIRPVRGLRFIDRQGKTWSYQHSILRGRLHFESDSDEKESITYQEMLSRWTAADWVVDPTGPRLHIPGFYHANRRPLSDYSAAEQANAEHKFNVIEPLVDKLDCTTNEIKARCGKFRNPKTGKVASVKSVRHWLATYRHSRDITALVDCRCRRRSLIHPRVVSIVEAAIENVFLTRDRKKKSEVLEEVRTLIENENLGVTDPAAILKEPSRATIYRLLREIEVTYADKMRLGTSEANNRHRTALRVQRVLRNLERVELDHVLLDIILVDESTGLPLGRPWLTIAIDCNSRLILGLHLSFDPPSATSVLQCLRNGVMPKADICKKFDLRNQWPGHGIWHCLVMDNALEMHGERLKAAALELCIGILYCPPGKPWYKGRIERFNRTLNEGLIHSLPGTTFSNPKQRAGYESKEKSCLGFRTFEKILHRWIVDDYHTRPHRAIRCSPLERWIACEEISAIILPESPATLELITARIAERSVFHYGVDIDQLRFNSPALQEIRRKLIPMTDGPRKAPKISCRYYDHTLKYIDVLDPVLNVYVRVEALDEEYTEGLDRISHHAIQQYLNETYRSRWTHSDRRRVKALNQDDVRISAEQTKRKRRCTARNAKAESKNNGKPRHTKPTGPAKTLIYEHMRSESNANTGGAI